MDVVRARPLLSFFLAFFFFFVFFVLVAATPAYAHIADWDDSWKARADEARAAALAAYNPDPEAVAAHANEKVHELLVGNSTRRELRRYTGKCLATNPIDRCWRCRDDWATRRKQLAKCALGPGTLRHAAIQPEPLWIVFARDMIIHLSEELLVTSYKTIDGRGANVHIAYGAGITLQFVQHVIIHGLHIHDIKAGGGGMIRDSLAHYGLRARSDGDGISIFGASNIWIDHVSMSNCMDGLIDVVQGSTAITISNNHFTHHDHRHVPGRRIMQITVAFNHFGRGLVQRMPRCRWGFFHVLNNDYTHWLMYAIGGASGQRSSVTHRVDSWDSAWKTWKWRSEGDLMMNGYSNKDMIKAKPGTFVTRLTRFAGALACRVNRGC
ncbi:unnamed protein product [Spirodela intermedia]|uniref:Pectate lyase n=1 Tax=Spirodela intermedia TaxID=51605 RepID=A0A7I8ISX3_SPIIN|nr:unnamed protein product [Spirodela intermedia]CAA6660880.1 unnamed protein product [Spirodela intermedia]